MTSELSAERAHNSEVSILLVTHEEKDNMNSLLTNYALL